MKQNKIKEKKVLNFIKYQRLYFFISGVAIIVSIMALFLWGLKPSIDFTGGTILELKTKNSILPEKEEIKKKALNVEIELSSVQESNENTYILRMKHINKDEKNKFLESLGKEFGEIEELAYETVGPTLGKELIKKTLTAILLAAGFIMLYVANRFKDKKFGVCAILAMFHDTLILLGVFAILGHFYMVEIDTLFVTAVLITLSFSVHDTVVVYDRIREGLKLFPKAGFEDLVNKAIVETLGRSVNNSLTIIFMLLVLYLTGGETIHWFILALLVGTIAGTYSSTFVAAPLLVLWDKIQNRKN